MTEMVRTERDGDVLVIIIENPPINAGSIEVRRGILAAIGTLDNDASLRAGVLIGGGSTFIAGSDLREFGRPLEEPQLPAVIAAIEACAKPVVAALHGAALGGGFELALGCDARVASPKTAVGLPEVSLGMIPGAGGTQRLPRLVGAAKAIRLICSGERPSADEARDLGIIDFIADGDLRQAAVRFAVGLTSKRRLRDVSVPFDAKDMIDAATGDAIKTGRGRPQVISAIEMVLAACTLPIDEALQRERALFQGFRMSHDAAALRHLFFAEREAIKLPAALQTVSRPVQTVAVIGAGTMGVGIAICALDAGLRVILLEQDKAALERGRYRVHEHYQSRVTDCKLKASVVSASEARLAPTTDWDQLQQADLVIEAVFEDLAVKQDVFRKIDQHARPGAVLATNTSYLDVDVIANATQRPQDVLGLHFFSPANVMKLLEVVRGEKTSPDVLATGMELSKKLRKLPVLSGNAFGFIGNRIYNAYRKQCEYMLEAGAWPEEVDSALKAFGFAMGPFAVADLSGLDIAWRMRKAQAGTRDPRERYVDILDHLCEQGRLGRKTGAGYYRYDGGKQAKTSDEVVRGIIKQASLQRGITRHSLGATEIQRRALLVMVNEAALLLAEGVSKRPSDIDVVLVQGYGFPRWEGGPTFWARQQDRAMLEKDLQDLARDAGHGFVLADLSHLLTS